MDVDRLAPGEELNPGDVTSARPAASLILLRPGTAGLEVLLVERSSEQRFMGGAWVFPGGALRHEESHADAAVRELEEEAGIRLEARSSLAPFSRWITPAEVKVRFDAHFFVAEAPPGARAEPDGRECVDARWLRPAEALDGHGDGELVLVFPTIKQLEQLAAFSSVAEVLEAAQGRRVRAIQPRVIVERGVERIVLPGEPGYDA